jgi:6-pyruvoyltetrahydropterin/6-carboxytetrahydropterin synthase
LYTIAQQRTFTAWHHLIGGDFGAESEPHTHDYKMEVRVEGPELDEHGYLVDLLDLGKLMDDIVKRFGGADLNKDKDFKYLNPSLENFARIVCLELSMKILGQGLFRITTQLWENETAWASFSIDL